MGDLIPKNTDDEMERYNEADMIRRARIPMENNAALVYEVDPVSKREVALFPLSSGGYVKIGDRAVTPAQAAETDVLAAQATVQNDGRPPIGMVMGGIATGPNAEGVRIDPTMEDYASAGYTEAEVIEYQNQKAVSPTTQFAVQLAPEQVQTGVDVGAPMLTTKELGMFEGGLSELVKGLVRGGLVEPSRFLKENFNIYDPLVFQFVDPRTGEFDPQLKIVSREEKAEIDRAIAAGEMPYAVDFEQLFETGDASQVGPGAQIVGGISQFIGAFAGVGKIFRIGKGFIGASTQGAAADFLGFGGNDGRLTDLLLELGMPENVVTDLLKTDPNNPDYVGRIKNAFEGGVLGAIAEPIARTIGMLARGGSRAELAQLIADLRTKSETAFSNGISDMIGTGRAIMQGDTEMLGEVFQPSGTARSLGAAAPDPNAAGAIIRPDDVYRGEGTPRITVRETEEPFVVRGTQQSQIDDMIQSGLVRPKPGGYGKDKKSSIYFGESSEALPTDVFGRPSETKFVLVGDSDKLAGTEGSIPIDQLRHVWVVRDGETVDILPEILQANREFDNFGAAGAGAVGAGASGAETTAQNITLAPASQEPMVGQLAPQYRVRVEGFTPEGTGRQSFIPRKLTPNNSQATIQKMSALTEEFPDPLSSPESYAGMMARVRNESEVPAPPTWMIENANNMEKWSGWFNGLTPDQIRAADNGLAVQNDFRSAYRGGAGPELTGQLMLWSILSRMLSAFPHESGFLDLAENATPFIQRAARGEWTDADTQAWLKMVPATIPLDSPGRSATSNANAFGETFLRKMAATDENGRSALLRLHEMIADPNMSSAEIRRQYYGLAEDTGIANKILSFALLVSGRNDVVVLDRIQINRMWAGGDKVYDDIMGQFEGAQGLAQYEALERSLAPRINDLYRMAGREGEGSVGRYHWESWVLSSGQVVSHPTLGSVVRAGEIAPGATTRSPVMEGRFHRWNYGVRYEKMPEGGNRYVYETSTGEPFQFTKAELDAMFKDVQKRSSGVLPPSFPGVSSFEGGNIPWYQYEGVNRERLDEIIRQSGKPVTE